ncbi:MAG: DegV family protein [Candidatus Izimaplasma sp.]|nr:DegV family protein [Candidatus Izimaplasma bacterium]
MKYKIITDSTTYFTESYFEKHNISRVSLNVLEGDKTYKELEITNEFIYEKILANKKLSTSQPSPAEFLAAYEKAIDEGYDTIFVVTVSKELSGTYQSALLAKKMLDEPNKIHLFDSIMAAYGNGLLVDQLRIMVDEDRPLEYIINRFNRLNKNSNLSFTIEDLKMLMKSGRISKAKAFIGRVLRVKPILSMDEGKLHLMDSERTYKKVIETITEQIVKTTDGFEKIYLRVVSKDSLELATRLKEEIESKIKATKITFSKYIGPVFSKHLGAQGFGVAWTVEGKK